MPLIKTWAFRNGKKVCYSLHLTYRCNSMHGLNIILQRQGESIMLDNVPSHINSTCDEVCLV
eukprot:scaffold103488_cov16-Prasinocladus_malaysianus.AAC.2